MFTHVCRHSILERSKSAGEISVIPARKRDDPLLHQSNLHFTKCFQAHDRIWSTHLCLKVGIRATILRWRTQEGEILIYLPKVTLLLSGSTTTGSQVSRTDLTQTDLIPDSSLYTRQSLSQPLPLFLFGS